MENATLDVTLLEPKMKHPTIFSKFDALKDGESLTIHNDHDPKPLYYQLLAERGNTFTWNYLENGPDTWKVKISKGNLGGEATIGDLVAQDFRKAEVFRKFGIDFCCGGKKKLHDACLEKGIDVLEVQKQLEQTGGQSTLPSQDFASWDAGFLADYIVNTHHRYINQTIPVIFQYTHKVAKVHGSRHPEAIEIADLFLQVTNELNRHMMKEERVLFPFIKKLAEAKKTGTSLEAPQFATVENPIRMMESEHEEVGLLMDRIRQLSGGYTPPADACTTFRLSYAKLKEFEDDLHHHIHLENNILFKKALELEKSCA